ncbi:MAG TPA: hypothetical protein VNF04_18195 [Stellaceae bacterium]|nr:hypothetical protein [Stellaceae bacterium]
MILTAIAPDRLPAVIGQFAAFLDEPSRAVFGHIADPNQARRAGAATAIRHHARACALASEFGMALLPGSPALDFAWNGRALRRATEAYVLLHEVAHFQIASPERRLIVDFGLGAGPETGDRSAGDHAAILFGTARETEEAMASLLGVLWEVELGQPGFASFLDQNWLEGAERPGAAAHFSAILAALRRRGVIDERHGRPQKRLAIAT